MTSKKFSSNQNCSLLHNVQLPRCSPPIRGIIWSNERQILSDHKVIYKSLKFNLFKPAEALLQRNTWSFNITKTAFVRTCCPLLCDGSLNKGKYQFFPSVQSAPWFIHFFHPPHTQCWFGAVFCSMCWNDLMQWVSQYLLPSHWLELEHAHWFNVVRLLPPLIFPPFHSYITCVNVILFVLPCILFDCNFHVTIDAAVSAGPLTFLLIYDVYD